MLTPADLAWLDAETAAGRMPGEPPPIPGLPASPTPAMLIAARRAWLARRA